MVAVAVATNEIRAPERYPSGKKKPKGQLGGSPVRDGMRSHRGHAMGGRNPYVEMHRVYDNWADLRRLGVNEDFGTVIGQLFMLEHLTAREASAARIYATVMGRFDRYEAHVNRQAKTPAYERGARGRDDEIERHEANDTIGLYVKRANRARKAFLKLCKAIPTDSARRLLDEVCIYDIMPTDAVSRRAVQNLLSAVAHAYGLKPEPE